MADFRSSRFQPLGDLPPRLAAVPQPLNGLPGDFPRLVAAGFPRGSEDGTATISAPLADHRQTIFGTRRKRRILHGIAAKLFHQIQESRTHKICLHADTRTKTEGRLWGISIRFCNLDLRKIWADGIFMAVSTFTRTPAHCKVGDDGAIDLVAEVNSSVVDWSKRLVKGKKRKLQIEIWFDGESINQVDVQEMRQRRGKFAVA